eukprot:1264724-Rhodomonas_salina.2
MSSTDPGSCATRFNGRTIVSMDLSVNNISSLASGTTRPISCYAMSGTDRACLPPSRCAMSGTGYSHRASRHSVSSLAYPTT